MCDGNSLLHHQISNFKSNRDAGILNLFHIKSFTLDLVSFGTFFHLDFFSQWRDLCVLRYVSIITHLCGWAWKMCEFSRWAVYSTTSNDVTGEIKNHWNVMRGTLGGDVWSFLPDWLFAYIHQIPLMNMEGVVVSSSALVYICGLLLPQNASCWCSGNLNTGVTHTQTNTHTCMLIYDFTRRNADFHEQMDVPPFTEQSDRLSHMHKTNSERFYYTRYPSVIWKMSNMHNAAETKKQQQRKRVHRETKSWFAISFYLIFFHDGLNFPVTTEAGSSRSNGISIYSWCVCPSICLYIYIYISAVKNNALTQLIQLQV